MSDVAGPVQLGHRVYPRAYGGTTWPAFMYDPDSIAKVYPRAYGGTNAPIFTKSTSLRSIPARTGEPTGQLTNGRHIPVYPRAYGGTIGQASQSASQATQTIVRKVYPRAYGGTSRASAFRQQSRSVGSIPARTGEPRTYRTEHPAVYAGVYPRAYGGTPFGFIQPPTLRNGLSPRVRGNRRSSLERVNPQLSPVYPRAYGGTVYSGSLSRRCLACRSIPARTGEPDARYHQIMRSRRSIPARTGEPVRPSLVSREPGTGLSPRVRGNLSKSGMNETTGLSPRVRGNRIHRRVSKLRQRSIPARTGEPACRSEWPHP